MTQSLNILESTKNNTKCNSTDIKTNINKNMFEFNYIIGRGGFGKVWRVSYKKTKEIFALKEMSKRKIIDKKSEKSINNERIFLSKLHHSFLVNMHFAFQDQDNLYLVIDILNGGDLRYHCSRYRKFSEEQTRFFIACMVHTLDYIHQNNVIHRDIKPENLVLDDKGYLHITDFGIAKENCEDNSNETSGTPGYMAPEVMLGLGHSFSVDFFAIGIIGYEFMLGKRPYSGKDRKEIKEQMFSYQAVIKQNEIAKGWSMESRDFINKLLKRKPELRLGSKEGIKELKEHFWLKYYPWKELENKTLPGPFIPEKRDNFDKRYCECADKITQNTRLRYEEIGKSEKFKNAFINFYFNKEENTKNVENANINSNKKDLPTKIVDDNIPSVNRSNKKVTNKVINNNNINKGHKTKENKENKNIIFNNLVNENNNKDNENKNNYNNNKVNTSGKKEDNSNNKRPCTSQKKEKIQKMKKSASQQLYEGVKLKNVSLINLLNQNSVILKNLKKVSKIKHKHNLENIKKIKNK